MDGVSSAYVGPGIFVSNASEQNIGALTWVATGQPSGTVSKIYRWSQQDDFVSMWFRVTTSVAGILVLNLSFSLPSDMPTPALFTVQPNGQEIAFGQGAITGIAAITAAATNMCTLRKNGSGVYEINLFSVGVAANFAWGSINYLAGP